MTIYFGYEKKKVLQALRYHFISRPEIRIMIILVNVFAIATFTLYFLKKIQSLAFLVGSLLWIILMISFWYILPAMVYRKAVTFKHEFSMTFEQDGFSLGHENGSKSWKWEALKNYLESPHFFHLYFDSRSFLLVPKDGCKDSDEVFELRGLIKSKVKKG
ncbi:MAG TPA: YcxB family protein [Chitinophagaceae bacterium]|nr:YcxB family protein [Chitinophagaceae bacterium]HQZ50960.1 YcxB family protein [Chitinophagaceae bacterium]HRA10384.1 YcxB family protein [Chitinophagaceae bacterium]